MLGVRALLADGHYKHAPDIYVFHNLSYLLPCAIITLAPEE